MNRIELLWELLERADLPGQAPVRLTREDIEAEDSGSLELLDGLGLIREVAPTELVACNQCLDVHIERVQYRQLPGGERLASIPCPTNGQSLINLEGLRRWQIDLPAFATRLARDCLNSGGPREVIDRRCWYLGARDGKTIFLVRGAHWPDAPSVFQGRLSFPQESYLLHLARLSPGFKHDGCHWFPLSQVFHPEEVRLVFPFEDSGKPVYEMRKEGRTWMLTFGSMSKPAPHRLGFDYIRVLLEHPGRQISALEVASSSSAGSRERSATIEDGLLVTDGYSTEKVMDERYRKELQQRISALAAKKNSRGLTPAEGQELDDLHRHLKAASDLHGRPRKVPAEAERARVSVTNAISRALGEITGVLPDMAQHLREHIKTGTYFSYEGEGVVSWSLPKDPPVTSHVTS